MYSSSLSTHRRCISVLHCSKQCHSSSTPGPFSSCAGFTFTTSTDENGFPSVHFSLKCTEISHRMLNPRIWRMFKYSNAFIGKKLLELLPQGLSHCLSVNTNHVCNHSHTQTSIFANNFTDFLNVLVSFWSRRVTWMLIIFHFLLPSLNLLCHSNTSECNIKLSPYTSFNNLMHSIGDVFFNFTRNFRLTCCSMLYKIRQFKNETGAEIWLIHRILQFNSYPLQCTLLPYLHTAAFVSSIVQSCAIAHQPPGRSIAMLFLPSSDGKWVPFNTLFTLVYRKKSQGAKYANMENVQVFECVYWEETSRAKGRCELGHCPDAASRRSSRDLAASSARFVALSLF